MKIIEQKKFDESSLSRILQYVRADRPFAVVSAYRGTNPINGWQVDNLSVTAEEISHLDTQAHDQLKAELDRSKYGQIPLRSGWESRDEESFFIPNCTYAFALSKKYKQQAMLWNEEGFFGVVYTMNFIDENEVQRREGERGTKFKKSISQGITFDSSVLKYAYSALKRANKNQQKKFAFQTEEVHEMDVNGLYEKITPSRIGVMVHRKLDFGYTRIA